MRFLESLRFPAPSELRRMALKYKKRTSVGVDHLHPRHYGFLSDEALQCLITLWRWMLTLGSPPEVVSTIIVSLLPKPEGGDCPDRPVANFATCIRLLTRWFRSTYGKLWSDSNRRPYVYGITGASSLHCVWKHSLLAEYAASKGLEVYSILLDIAKAFENVLHHILVRRALDLGFNIWLLKFLLALYRGPRVIVVGSVPGVLVHATQTIVAGCAFADLLMRCMLIEDLDHIVALHR